MSDYVSSSAEAVAHELDLIPFIVLLAAAVVMVPLFRRLGLGTVLGYLAAGLIIGPYGLALFQDAQAIIHFAELGVVLFLFIIGLEMHPSRLWKMRGEIFGLGVMQVGLAMFALIWVGILLGYPVAASFIAGTGFVLTSTAIVFQMLQERKLIGQSAGRRMISILLLEDLAIVPLLILVTFLAPGVKEVTMSERIPLIAIGLSALVAVVLAGRYLLDPMFRLIARFGVREIMTAAALLVVLSASLLMDAVGLSMAMGAFLAGVVLSESSFRHQLEADIEPFRGLLLGLFFLGVGMALDLNIIIANWPVIAISVFAFMTLKMAIIYGVARIMKAERSEATLRMVLMAQGGEFAFVLYAAATQVGVLSQEWNATLTAIIIISMMLTPLMLLIHDRFVPKSKLSMDGVEQADGLAGRALLIGFGRFGQIVSQPLLARGHSLSIIDIDPQAIRNAKQFGFKVFYGDGKRLEILRAAGAHQATIIIVAASDRDSISRIVELSQLEFPLVPVLARALNRQHAQELMRLGVAFQVRETYESALSLGREALFMLAENEEDVENTMAEVRARDAERMALELVGGMDVNSRALVHGNLKQHDSSHQR